MSLQMPNNPSKNEKRKTKRKVVMITDFNTTRFPLLHAAVLKKTTESRETHLYQRFGTGKYFGINGKKLK